MVNSLTTEELKVWLAPAGTLGSELATLGTEITSLYTNYDRSGLERDMTSQAVGSGGFIDVMSTISQGEISVDLTATNDDDRALFSKIDAGTIPTGMIAFQYGTGTNAMWSAYNNCTGNVEFDHASDAELKGSLTLKFSPANKNGYWNMASYSGAVITDTTNGLKNTTQTTFKGVTRNSSWVEEPES